MTADLLDDNISSTNGVEGVFRLPTKVRMATLLLLSYSAGVLLISKTYFNLYLLFSALLLIFYFFFYKKLKVGAGFALAGMLLYSVWLLRGLTNPAVHIDLKYHLAWALSLLIFANLLGKLSNPELLRYLFRLNLLLFAVYLLLLAKAIPNAYVVEDLPEYQAFRLFGPVLVSFYAICMTANYSSLERWPRRNLYLLVNLGLGTVVAILSGSLQHFAIFATVYLLTFFRRRHLVRFVLALGLGIVLFFGSIWFFGTEQHRYKFRELLNPLQSPTLLTRANDLFYMLGQKSGVGQVMLGDGLGVTSEVFRVSTRGGKLVEFREFLEIDNGFYYIYHRTGLVGLALFLMLHAYLLKKYGNPKNRMCFLVFFVVTNALSIHYFTNPMSALMCYLLVRREEREGAC